MGKPGRPKGAKNKRKSIVRRRADYSKERRKLAYGHASAFQTQVQVADGPIRSPLLVCAFYPPSVA